MHSVSCPACGTRVELDFQPVAGMVWCPKCKKTFSLPASAGPEPQKAEHIERPDHRDEAED